MKRPEVKGVTILPSQKTRNLLYYVHSMNYILDPTPIVFYLLLSSSDNYGNRVDETFSHTTSGCFNLYGDGILIIIRVDL